MDSRDWEKQVLFASVKSENGYEQKNRIVIYTQYSNNYIHVYTYIHKYISLGA